MSRTGDGIEASNANWKFSDETAKHFDNHVSKSVPLYDKGHELVCALSDYFVKNNSLVYELGSSTGELSLKLAGHNAHLSNTSFIGVEIEPDMIAQAREKQKARGIKSVSFVEEDILQMELEPADMIVAYYTVQFIRPSERQRLIDKLYKSLKWGGALILFEKVRGSDARFQDILTGLYTDYKVAQGYSAEEILAKARSLKGVLEPFSTQGNLDMLTRAGFVDVMSVMKYICFEGFLAIK